MSVGSVQSGSAVTPADDTDLSKVTRGLYVGVTGDVQVTLESDSSAVVLKNLIQGVVHPLKVSRVWESNTTATDIVAIY